MADDNRDEPGARALIAQTRAMLTEQLLPDASGDMRLNLLMMASALGMAERELAHGPALDAAMAAACDGAGAASPRALAEAIRQGRHDGSAQLHAALEAISALHMSIAKGKS